MSVIELASAASAARDIETITAEILELKQTAGSAILNIGQRLIEAKEMLDHGEWLPWLEERVEFSERSAQNFMRLAREWSNPQTLADLGASKALTLLALPPVEREEFLSEEHVVNGEAKSVVDMSARELEKAVKARDAALKQAELDRAEKDAARQAQEKMQADLTFANERLAGLREELEALKNRPIDVAVESASEEELAKARAEGEAAKAAELDRLQEALEKAVQARQAAEAQLAAAQKTQAPSPVSADKDLTQFAVRKLPAKCTEFYSKSASGRTRRRRGTWNRPCGPWGRRLEGTPNEFDHSPGKNHRPAAENAQRRVDGGGAAQGPAPGRAPPGGAGGAGPGGKGDVPDGV